MADVANRRAAPTLQVSGLNVYYGASHALQGVDLTLDQGALSLVGRNGMGKTTLCMAILGLVPVASGSIRFAGTELSNRSPTAIARLGIGYVPQGRRLWRTLTVDEHLRMVAGLAKSPGNWTRERVYATFPRLAERMNNGGGQLSGGEQQMLAISRALLLNPRLLVMDEPTEGLAPVIVAQVEHMLHQLAEDGDMDVLVIEQNIGVACGVSDEVAIMVNGRIERRVAAARLSADRVLQQRLLGVGRVADAGSETDDAANGESENDAAGRVDRETSSGVPRRASPGGKSGATSRATNRAAVVYLSNPTLPHRWSRPANPRLIERTARTAIGGLVPVGSATTLQPVSAVRSIAGSGVVLVVGTLDTKGRELRFIRDRLAARSITARLVDISTSGGHAGADVPAHQVAAFHPRGSSGVFTNDRGTAVAGMTLAFERWMRRQGNVLGVIGAGGSGNTAMVAPALRALPFGVPKVLVSTVASGDTSPYVGPSDILMLHSVADVQGLNSITREVLSNGSDALAGMVAGRREAPVDTAHEKQSALGITMFGVTTACVQQLVASLDDRFDCLVFHATGIGGRSMESLVDDGRIDAVLDMTTTEVCDLLMGGVFAATEDRFGAVIRRRMPYVGACGALDMVNFGARDTVPSRYAGRLLYEHNPQVTLMRTTVEENVAVGRWIGERLNRMDGPVRFFLPEGGVSALDAPGQAFHDPRADAALFDALEKTVRQTSERRLVRTPHHINDPAFAAGALDAFGRINAHLAGGRRSGRQKIS